MTPVMPGLYAALSAFCLSGRNNRTWHAVPATLDGPERIAVAPGLVVNSYYGRTSCRFAGGSNYRRPIIPANHRDRCCRRAGPRDGYGRAIVRTPRDDPACQLTTTRVVHLGGQHGCLIVSERNRGRGYPHAGNRR